MGRFWRASRSHRGSTQSGRLTRTDFLMLDRNAWWQSYSSKPVGIRNQEHLQLWCIKCYSDNIYVAKTTAYTFCRCKECSFEWDFGPCWSCGARYVDSRDPANTPCHCGWYRCVVCKACNSKGCKQTNPYSKKHRYSDESHVEDTLELEEDSSDVCELCGCLGADQSFDARFICGDCANNMVTYYEK